MHDFLRAIGFRNVKTEKDFNPILNDAAMDHDNREIVLKSDDCYVCRITKYYSDDAKIGLEIYGEYIEDDVFRMEYYHPFFNSDCVSAREPVELQRHAATNSYAGICDDDRLDISIIFYLNEEGSVRSSLFDEKRFDDKTIYFSGLCKAGRVLLPVLPSIRSENSRVKDKVGRFCADSEVEDIDEDDENVDLFPDFTPDFEKRLKKDDVYTIVNTFLMPYGVETDQYMVLGEINAVRRVQNKTSGEYVYIIRLTAKNIQMDICVNEGDIQGAPEPGRRFKGIIWLQGRIE
ncbi:MAG: DUF3881 family protein [Lachnospiraceae bacterium]|nr:DUF3881 family protein [Lachnospiraceae bacterium]MCR4946107.1 DUF3881 family protein [Lachnospiraceae bacterium]